MAIIIGTALWVLALGLWGFLELRRRRRRRRHPPTRTPQQVWDESDPQERSWTFPPTGGPIGSP